MHPEVLLVLGWINHDKTTVHAPKKFDDETRRTSTRSG